MQVDKQPSPWPCVAMLVGLLLFCLAAPRYWQPDDSPNSSADIELTNEHAGEGRFFDPTASSGLALPDSRFEFGDVKLGLFGNIQNADNSNPWATPTIEELVAARSVGPFDSSFRHDHGRSFDWPIIMSPTDSSFQPDDSNTITIPTEPVQPGPFVTSSLEFMGALYVEYSPASIFHEAASRLVEEVPTILSAWSKTAPGYNSDFASRSTLRLTRPGDRLAMLPTPPKKTSWCVPQVLFEQLERLGDHAYSAQWASHVGNQLHALTEREQLEGDDVQSILADLTDSAQEALHMADNSDDNQLRVELLRAHWALARRLDCWAAMHEERVALRFHGRVAARGSLGPYFDNTAQSPAGHDVLSLSRDLETYEKTRDPQLGRQVVEQQRSLASSPGTYDRALAESMEQHYRNANIRLAITAEMLNRMLGPEKSESRPIRDRIAGASVRGQSEIRSESRVQLAPANDEWQLEVQTNGVVESDTFANAGPVRLRSKGATQFSGTKSVIVDSMGVRLQPSDVEATSNNRLVGVTTDYDWVPLFGGYARDRAMQEYHAKQGWARTQVESRITFEAESSLDRETHEAMESVRKKLYDRFTDRFSEYGIKLTTVEMKSTPERLVARVRVAGDDQLGSHTPRPRALSDSLASVQVHESAMTNLAMTLGLDGKRYTAPELQATLRNRFPQLVVKDPLDTRHDTVFQFAPKDAVQFHINNGRLELTIAFDSVELEGAAMDSVIVHAFYVPAVDGMNAELARDGALGIEGRFSPSERGRLHNIFKSVLPPERHLSLVHFEDPNDRRFEGLMITQLVLEDGWVGLAIGPESNNRVAERSRSLR